MDEQQAQDQSPNQENPQTPSQESPNSNSDGSTPSPGIIGGVKPNNRKYRRTLGEDGKPKKNFYNPPGKVMRQMAQQQYHSNMYGNNGQFYNLKQKFKTQMCKHFLKDGECPLKQYCQFAHGPDELRQANDVSYLSSLNILFLATSRHFWQACSGCNSLKL